jgi:hypothetical protein
MNMYIIQNEKVAQKRSPCHSCKGNFKVGDEVVVRGQTHNRKYYHAACWDQLFYEESVEVK